MCAVNDNSSKWKLCVEAKRLIRKRIAAGDRNAQVREELERTGHYHQVSDKLLTYYRKHSKVKEALEAQHTEVIQAGLGFRARRIAVLVKLAEETYNKMMGLFPGHPDMPRVPCSKEDWVLMGRELRAYLRDIEALVGGRGGVGAEVGIYEPGSADAAAGGPAPIPAGIHPMLTDGFALGMLNDALEKFLDQVEAQEQGKQEGEVPPAIEGEYIPDAQQQNEGGEQGAG